MQFTQYPTKRDQANRRNGRKRDGQYLSLAPGGVWIIPRPREENDPPVALFGHRYRSEFYVIESEQSTKAAVLGNPGASSPPTVKR